MGWESSGVVGFDLGSLLQGQMNKTKSNQIYFAAENTQSADTELVHRH